MSEDEQITGISDNVYNLSSVLYHALQGGASYDTYIEDAEREGDEELAGFFRRIRDEDSVRADDAWLLLARRIPTAARTKDRVPRVAATERSETNVPPRTEPSGGLAGQLSPTESISAPPGPRDVPSRRMEADSTVEEERTSREEREEDRDLTERLADRARDALLGEEERRREGTDGEDRR